MGYYRKYQVERWKGYRQRKACKCLTTSPQKRKALWLTLWCGVTCPLPWCKYYQQSCFQALRDMSTEHWVGKLYHQLSWANVSWFQHNTEGRVRELQVFFKELTHPPWHMTVKASHPALRSNRKNRDGSKLHTPLFLPGEFHRQRSLVGKLYTVLRVTQSCTGQSN